MGRGLCIDEVSMATSSSDKGKPIRILVGYTYSGLSCGLSGRKMSAILESGHDRLTLFVISGVNYCTQIFLELRKILTKHLKVKPPSLEW